MIRSKAGGKLAQWLGREVRFGAIDVAMGHDGNAAVIWVTPDDDTEAL